MLSGTGSNRGTKCIPRLARFNPRLALIGFPGTRAGCLPWIFKMAPSAMLSSFPSWTSVSSLLTCVQLNLLVITVKFSYAKRRHAIRRLHSMSNEQIGRRSTQVKRANLCSVGVISSAKQLLKVGNGEQILASTEDRFIYNSWRTESESR